MYPMATMQLTAALNLQIARKLLERNVPHRVILMVLDSLEEASVEAESAQREFQGMMNKVDVAAFMKP